MIKQLTEWISSHFFWTNTLNSSDFRKIALQTDAEMKILIIGLGNIGQDYENTRHNIGFEIANQLVDKYKGEFDSVKYGAMAQIKIKNKQLFVLKPNTYMNRSGAAVSYWLKQLKIDVDQSLTILDDLNIDFGSIRIKKSGSPGGHNGLKDISEKLAHSNYPRLRFGIGNDYRKGQQVDFVLGQWSSEEKDALIELLPYSVKMIETFSLSGIGHAMQLNKK